MINYERQLTKKKPKKNDDRRKPTTLRVLFIGDIVHRIGRRAIAKVLPELRKEYDLDLVIGNGEHISTGYGMTEKAYYELIEAGVDYITSGNHIWRKREFVPLLDSREIKVLRPANYPEGVPGRGYDVIEIKGQKVVLMNFIGLLFINPELDSPFRKADEILDKVKDIPIKIVDFHADISSEKVAFGLYLDGRVSAVIGTHTHVPTADAQILEGKTAYVSDVGMVGPKGSVLGVKKDIILKKFVTGLPGRHESETRGECIVNAVLFEINSSGEALKIERVDREVMVD